MFGGPFDAVKARLQLRIKLFNKICKRFCVLIDEMPELNAMYPSEIVDLKLFSARNRKIYSFSRYLRYVETLFLMGYHIYIISKKYDVFLFVTGIPIILPLIVEARILGKKTIIMGGGTASKPFSANNPLRKHSIQFLQMLEAACFKISNVIAAENKSSSRFLDLDKYGEKVQLMGSLIYIDIESFKKTIDLAEREYIIGFVGDLAAGKGILNLIESLSILVEYNQDIKVLIIGDGPLSKKIQDEIW
jgi:glycosyltransferase involved in cell wall biosynthesis